MPPAAGNLTAAILADFGEGVGGKVAFRAGHQVAFKQVAQASRLCQRRLKPASTFFQCTNLTLSAKTLPDSTGFV